MPNSNLNKNNHQYDYFRYLRTTPASISILRCMFGMFIFDHYQPDIYISYQNTTKTLTFVTLFITLFHFKHSFLTNETLNSHINHIYNIFTYISTNERIFITIYNQITIKQHTSKIIIKTRIYTQP